MCACVRACVCVCACVRACARAVVVVVPVPALVLYIFCVFAVFHTDVDFVLWACVSKPAIAELQAPQEVWWPNGYGVVQAWGTRPARIDTTTRVC